VCYINDRLIEPEESQPDSVEYPTIDDLYHLSKELNGHSIRKSIKIAEIISLIPILSFLKTTPGITGINIVLITIVLNRDHSILQINIAERRKI
jgi:hypothetical protein